MKTNQRRSLAAAVSVVLACGVVSFVVPNPREAQAQSAGVYPKPSRLAGQEYPTYYGGYRTVAGFSSFVADVAEFYPGVAKRIEYGSSWLKTQDPAAGHTLEALCITANVANNCKLAPNSSKPRFMLVTQMHAREISSSEMAWRFVTKLMDGYPDDAEVRALLDHTEVWVVPQANPDGVDVVQEGVESDGTGEQSRAWQRKNVNDDNAS